jgi:hypothetical protein
VSCVKAAPVKAERFISARATEPDKASKQQTSVVVGDNLILRFAGEMDARCDFTIFLRWRLISSLGHVGNGADNSDCGIKANIGFDEQV